MSIILLVTGIIMLVVGAEVFVNSSVNVAKKLKISTVVIALTIIAIGTSAPETVISLTASAHKHSELSMSNIIGSNFFNLLFIIGLCALIRPINVVYKEVGPEAWLMVCTTTALFLVMLGTFFWFGAAVPREVGAGMVVIFFIYLWLLIRHSLRINRATHNITNRTTVDLPQEKVKPLWLSSIGVIFGLLVILYGGELTVLNAAKIANDFGITQRIIGLTIIGAGTSLPELLICLLACKRRESGIALGTIVGTNIYNLNFILGASAIIDPLEVDRNQMHDVAMLAFGHLMVLIFIMIGKKLTRLEGFIMLALYLSYLGYSIINNV